MSDVKKINFDSFKYTESDEKEEVIEMDTSILSDEQLIAYNKFKQGENVFLTGPGGTGKTKLIQYFVYYAKNRGDKLQVCAMTGCAAILLNCGARTLHSWSGIKLARGDKHKVIESVIKNKNAMRNWKKTRVLIIDEVSMMSKKIFEIIEEVARVAKKIDLPFGGMQIVFSGDFCQLPPIETYGEIDTSKFCFDSVLWGRVFSLKNHVVLKKIFRQNDVEYMNILQNIRKGVLTRSNYEALKGCLEKKFDEEKYNGCIPTKLFPLRSRADYVNNVMYSNLTGENHCFEVVTSKNNITMVDNNKLIEPKLLQKCNLLSDQELEFEAQQYVQNLPCIQKLCLKVGAAVMCNVNLDMDNAICNGSQGIVLNISGPKNEIITVKFSNGIIKHITPYVWQNEDYPCITVKQYPLCLAWALTIHKIQGATLELAEIDVGNTVFEYGQTYVALSRVKSLDGLYLSDFNPEKIQTNPVVVDFYDKIMEMELKVELNPTILEKEQDTSDTKKIKL